MTATSDESAALENAGPLFTSVTLPQPMMPQRTCASGSRTKPSLATPVVPAKAGTRRHAREGARKSLGPRLRSDHGAQLQARVVADLAAVDGVQLPARGH